MRGVRCGFRWLRCGSVHLSPPFGRQQANTNNKPMPAGKLSNRAPLRPRVLIGQGVLFGGTYRRSF